MLLVGFDRSFDLHDGAYGYYYMLRHGYRDPRTATVRVDDLSAPWFEVRKNNKKIFSLSLTPVLNPTQDYSSRDRKNFSTAFHVHPVLKGSIFRKILPFAIARLTRAQIFFANCFFSTRFQY